jgi:hypothetical protein
MLAKKEVKRKTASPPLMEEASGTIPTLERKSLSTNIIMVSEA